MDAYKKPEPEKGKKVEEGQWPNGVTVLRIWDVYPGFRIQIFSNPDPGYASKNLSSLIQKIVSKN
jgi:hypothetical protein